MSRWLVLAVAGLLAATPLSFGQSTTGSFRSSSQPPRAATPPVEVAPAGTMVQIDALKGIAPTSWIVEKTNDRIRTHQFRLPRQKNDTADAEVIVLSVLPGSTDENIKKWRASFVRIPGENPADAAKVYATVVGGSAATGLDIHGTYLAKDKPFDRSVKEDVRTHYRMIAVIVQTTEGQALVRMVGPEATVAFNKKAFDEFLKSFK